MCDQQSEQSRHVKPCLYSWAAGLFDGEGCISKARPSRPGGLFEPRLSLGNNDFELVDRMHGVFGGSIYGPYGGGVGPDGFLRKQRWFWVVEGYDQVVDALAPMAPWLSQRRLERARDLLLLSE
jgi:hypothetical protein